MDARFLPLNEFHRVHFYRLFTLVCLVGMLLMTLFSVASGAHTSRGDVVFIGVVMGAMAWRFALEWRWVNQCGPAFVLNNELVISHNDSHRQIPLANIAMLSSRHCWLMARRYRSWRDHLAIVEITLHSGERLCTLVDSGVLEFPAGKQSLTALRAAVLEAKVKSAGAAPQGI